MVGQGRSFVHVIDDDEAVRESLEALLFYVHQMRRERGFIV